MPNFDKMTKKDIILYFTEELHKETMAKLDAKKEAGELRGEQREMQKEIDGLKHYKKISLIASELINAQIHLGTELEPIEGSPFQEMGETFGDDVKFLTYLRDQLARGNGKAPF